MKQIFQTSYYSLMKTFSYIIITLAIVMMVGTGIKILTESLVFIVSFLLGYFMLLVGISLKPKR
jgi:hypothetical protein